MIENDSYKVDYEKMKYVGKFKGKEYMVFTNNATDKERIDVSRTYYINEISSIVWNRKK